MRLTPVRALIGLFAAAMPNAAIAQVVIPGVEATLNSTVQPGGPRQGTGGDNFFNVEGNSFATFASFGAADFAAFSTPGTLVDVNSVTVTLVESNAAFTAAGTVNFYFATDTTSNIKTSGGPPNFISGPGSEGVGAQLGTLHFLGSGSFTTTGSGNSGQVDTYTFTGFSGAVESYILGQLNGGQGFRLVVTPGTDGVAATWAGVTNSSFAGPTLAFNVTPVPEPASILGISAAGLGVAGWVRRRRTAA